MRKRSRFKRSFRKNKRINHPTYLLGRNGNKLDYVGITHSDTTDGEYNLPLDKNPNPRDKKRAFLRPKIETDEPKNFGRRYEDWKFSEKDKKTVQKLYDKSKKKK